MTPWLLFGAGGKGVGARTLELALAEQRPVVAVVRHADAATKLAQQGVQVFTGDACDASVAVSRLLAAQLAPGCAYHLNNGRSSGLYWRTEQ